jgi:hypothetical protein
VAKRLVVGVVSDTHGLVRAEAVEALRGADVAGHRARLERQAAGRACRFEVDVHELGGERLGRDPP